MDHLEAENFVREIYSSVLGREPREKELAEWTAKTRTSSPASIIAAFRKSKEYAAKRKTLKTFAPVGHYYSPIVDPANLLVDYYNRERTQAASDIRAIDLDLDRMVELWNIWKETLASTDFPVQPTNGKRFYSDNGNFPYGDAAVLRATIAERRPKRIVEIGSGNSSACMLDAIDEFGLDTKITCIEPDPPRLNALLRPEDSRRLELFAMPVQDAPLYFFSELEAGDILFIDSTHVVKTASDVHHEFFHILPLLRDGVLVHFHDCPFPFEYPAKWVLTDNMSWNEVYFLRAFLMYNSRFKVRFWPTMFHQMRPELIRETIPQMEKVPHGSGIWVSCGDE